MKIVDYALDGYYLCVWEGRKQETKSKMASLEESKSSKQNNDKKKVGKSRGRFIL